MGRLLLLIFKDLMRAYNRIKLMNYNNISKIKSKSIMNPTKTKEIKTKDLMIKIEEK